MGISTNAQCNAMQCSACVAHTLARCEARVNKFTNGTSTREYEAHLGGVVCCAVAVVPVSLVVAINNESLLSVAKPSPVCCSWA
jgi:hypothetical protein